MDQFSLNSTTWFKKYTYILQFFYIVLWNEKFQWNPGLIQDIKLEGENSWQTGRYFVFLTITNQQIGVRTCVKCFTVKKDVDFEKLS